METAIVSLICIALIVFGGMTMSRGFLTSVDSSTTGLEEMSNRSEEIMRTELSSANATMLSSSTLEIRLTNTGQTKLADFNKWDFIVQYYDDADSYHVKWLPYTTGAPGSNEWSKTGIYLNGGAEAFEPNILNPGEEISLQAELNPPAGAGTTNLAIISTPNGIPVSAVFTR